MNKIKIVIPGPPRGKGRPKFAVHGKHAVVYTDAKTRSYEESIAVHAKIAMAHRHPLEGPLSVRMLAYFPYLKDWTKAQLAAAQSGEVRPAKYPDPDNIFKCIDAIQGIIIWNDNQIVDASISKYYDEVPRLEIVVRKVFSPGTGSLTMSDGSLRAYGQSPRHTNGKV